MNGLAPEDRPREKLLAQGAEVLGTNELVAVVLGTGTRNLSALELANQILSSTGGLEGLARSTPDSLTRLRGLKSARTARLVAALELGRRTIAEPPERRPYLPYSGRRGEISLASIRGQAGGRVRRAGTRYAEPLEASRSHLSGKASTAAWSTPARSSGRRWHFRPRV